MNRRVALMLSATGTLLAIAAGATASAGLTWTGVMLAAAAELVLAAAAVTVLRESVDHDDGRSPQPPTLDDLLVRDHTRRAR